MTILSLLSIFGNYDLYFPIIILLPNKKVKTKLYPANSIINTISTTPAAPKPSSTCAYFRYYFSICDERRP